MFCQCGGMGQCDKADFFRDVRTEILTDCCLSHELVLLFKGLGPFQRFCFGFSFCPPHREDAEDKDEDGPIQPPETLKWPKERQPALDNEEGVPREDLKDEVFSACILGTTFGEAAWSGQ